MKLQVLWALVFFAGIGACMPERKPVSRPGAQEAKVVFNTSPSSASPSPNELHQQNPDGKTETPQLTSNSAISQCAAEPSPVLRAEACFQAGDITAKDAEVSNPTKRLEAVKFYAIACQLVFSEKLLGVVPLACSKAIPLGADYAWYACAQRDINACISLGYIPSAKIDSDAFLAEKCKTRKVTEESAAVCPLILKYMGITR